MKQTSGSRGAPFTTSGLAAETGYSLQQVRDLERLGVIPPAPRRPNGYRQFTMLHATALRAYRQLAISVGPVDARRIMSELPDLPYDEAVARIVALHVDLARTRENTLAAVRALDSIVDEADREAAAAPQDSMNITELSTVLGVRSSTLRFWEQEGLIIPERAGHRRARNYPVDSIRDARIVTALRSGGYRIPAVRAVIASLRTTSGARDARESLHNRLQSIATQSEALLRAGADISDLLHQPDPSGIS